MKNNKKRKYKILVFFMLVSFIFVALYNYSNKMLMEIGKTTYQSMLSNSVYYAISNTIITSYNYEDFIHIEKDSSNNITMITTDSYKFNNLTSKIAENVSKYFEQNAEYVKVPLGVFTGIRLCSGFGPRLNVKIIVITSIKCDIVSKFESAGINQTRHSLYLDIMPDVSIVSGGKSAKMVDKISLLVFENFISGKVPEIYMTSGIYSSKKYM